MNSFTCTVLRCIGMMIALTVIVSCQKETGLRPLPESAMLFIPAVPSIRLDSVQATGLPARFYGSVTSEGSEAISAYGFCFSASQALPAVSDSSITSSASLADLPYSFSLSTAMLKHNTRYYLRAYAKNSQGIGYSENVITFMLPDNRTVPAVETNTLENMTGNSVNVKAMIIADGESPINAYGVCFSSTNQNPELSDQITISGTSSPASLPYAYSQSVQGLVPNTTYYLRAFASNEIGTAYGSTRSFRTVPVATEAPTVQTDNIVNILANGAMAEGKIISTGTSAITRYGFCFSSVNTNPTVSDGVIVSGTTSPATVPFPFSGSLERLTANTTYYVRAFATSSAGTSYGVPRNFKTISLATSPPVVTTHEVPVTSITTASVLAKGTLQSQGTAAITQYGFCFSSVQTNPSISDQVKVFGTTSPANFPSDFSAAINGLSPGKNYFIRAYAINSAGTSYGASQPFRTVAIAAVPPSIQTVNVSAVAFTTANVLGNLVEKGSSEITSYGFVYSSTNANPDVADSKVVAGTATPSTLPYGYTATLTGLTPGTGYSTKAFAISAAGTVYGEVKRFVTSVATPSITTDQVIFSEATSTVTATGTIQNKGASDVTRYGFCYSATNSNPTVSDHASDVGTAVTGRFPFSFSKTGTRLSAGNYYFRAYAANASGIAYGNIHSVTVFTSPVVATENAIDKNPEAGIETLYGVISSGGSSPVQEYGFCYIPTSIASSRFAVGDRNVAVVRTSSPVSGTFPFRYFMDVTVSYNVDYSYRAYVKTANGYAYGQVRTFYISYKP